MAFVARLPPEHIRLVRFEPWSTPEDIHLFVKDNVLLADGPDLQDFALPRDDAFRDDAPSVVNGYFGAQAHSYRALSYCWGNANDFKTLHLNGSHFDVTRNLWHALSAILAYHIPDATKVVDFWLWIDAICINQADLQERNAQVQQMWRVYSQAEVVLSWLGLSDESADLAFDAIHTAMETCQQQQAHDERAWCLSSFKTYPEPMYEIKHPEPGQEIKAAITRLLSRDYFKRTWIVQEYLQARRIRLICGKHTCRNKAISHYTTMHLVPYGVELGHFERLALFRTAKVWDTDLLDVVRLFAGTQCHDVRDKIFAMIGHPYVRWTGFSRAERNVGLRVDYSLQPHELLFHFLEWWSLVITTQPDLDYILEVCTHVWHSLGLGDSFHTWLRTGRHWPYPVVILEPDGLFLTLPGEHRIMCSGTVMRQLFQGDRVASRVPIDKGYHDWRHWTNVLYMTC